MSSKKVVKIITEQDRENIPSHILGGRKVSWCPSVKDNTKNNVKPQRVSSRSTNASKDFVPMTTIVEKPNHFGRVTTLNIPCPLTLMNTNDDRIIQVTPIALQDSFLAGRNTLIIDARLPSERVNGTLLGAFLATLSTLYLRRLRKGMIAIEKLIDRVDEFSSLLATAISQISSQCDDDVICPLVVCYTTKGTCMKGSCTETILRHIADRGLSVGYIVGGFDAIHDITPDLVKISAKSSIDIMLCFNQSRKKIRINPDELVIPVNESKIRENIYIGTGENAQDPTVIKKHNITIIVNCTRDVPNAFEAEGIKYINVPVSDLLHQPIREHFDRTFAFIDEELEKGGRVLLHCHAGISRSSTICIAYIMRKERRSFDSVFAEVREKRKQASPNIDFIGQLLSFERSLHVKIPSRVLAST